jgi:hypothetical protein
LKIVSLPWNDTSNASPRIRVISQPTWNKMNVTVHHSLTADIPAVDSYVEAHHRGVRF